MIAQHDLKQHILASLDTLPDEMLQELAMYLEYLNYKLKQPSRTTPYQPVALGGLWEGVAISDEDIADVRREMWSDPTTRKGIKQWNGL